MTRGRTALIAFVGSYVGAMGCRGGATPTPALGDATGTTEGSTFAPTDVTASPAPEPMATGAGTGDASVDPSIVAPPRGAPPHGRFRCGKTWCHAPDEVCCGDDDDALTCVKRDPSSTTGEPWALDRICGVGANAHFAAECGDPGNCADGAYCCDPGQPYWGAFCTHSPSSCVSEVCASPATCRIRNQPKPVRCGGGTCPIGTPCCRQGGKESCSKTCNDGLALSCRGPADCTGPLACCTGSFPDSSGTFRTSAACRLSCTGATSGVYLCSAQRDCSSDGSYACVGTCGGSQDAPVCRTDADCATTTDAGPQSNRCSPQEWLGSRYCYYFGSKGGS